MKKTAIIFTSILLLLSGCDVFKQIGGAYQLSQCEYTYHSVDDIQIAGINIGDGSRLSLSNLASISTILAASSKMQTIPLTLTLNMNIKNPNEAVAFLNSLDYAIEINDLEFTNGKIDIPLQINPGETQTMPIHMSTDLKQLMNRYSQEKVSEVINSFFGISAEQTRVKVNLWPKVLVGKTPVKSPAAIPVIFTFGGKS
jgi:LEA14-like dessication related protein